MMYCEVKKPDEGGGATFIRFGRCSLGDGAGAREGALGEDARRDDAGDSGDGVSGPLSEEFALPTTPTSRIPVYKFTRLPLAVSLSLCASLPRSPGNTFPPTLTPDTAGWAGVGCGVAKQVTVVPEGEG